MEGAPCSAAGSSCITAGTVRLPRGATATLQGDSSSVKGHSAAQQSNPILPAGQHTRPNNCTTPARCAPERLRPVPNLLQQHGVDRRGLHALLAVRVQHHVQGLAHQDLWQEWQECAFEAVGVCMRACVRVTRFFSCRAPPLQRPAKLFLPVCAMRNPCRLAAPSPAHLPLQPKQSQPARVAGDGAIGCHGQGDAVPLRVLPALQGPGRGAQSLYFFRAS